VRGNVEIDADSVSDKLAGSIGERKLWATVLIECHNRACYGEALALNFFKRSGDMFTTLCNLMDLPEQSIRERVLSKAAVKMKRNKQL
jgi:hypothetical protein